MRITSSLIERSPSFTFTLSTQTRFKVLDLRGNSIPSIENLSFTNNFFDTIDLTDNDIKFLGNFPVLDKLCVLIICNNSIKTIDTELDKCLEHLIYLNLANNDISDFNQIKNLFSLKNLKSLVLIENPISKDPSYFSVVTSLLPQLCSLDGVKIKRDKGLCSLVTK